MRQALSIALISIFLVAAVVGLIVGYVSAENIASENINREIELARSAISKKLGLFDVLLAREEEIIDQRLKDALPLIAENLLTDSGNFETVSLERLKSLSAQLGVDNVYVIDNRTVVVATDFVEDLGFELGTISEGFRSYIMELLGSGKIEIDQINLSSKTGILTKYAYFSPKGSDYIVEASINLRNFLAKERSPEFVDFLFNSFFKDLINSSQFLESIDIHMINQVARFSLFDRNQNLPENVARELHLNDRIIIHKGQYWTVYSKISPVGTRLSTADFLAITLGFDFSVLTERINSTIILLVGLIMAVSALTYLLVAHLAGRYIVDRIKAVLSSVDLIAKGDYEHDLSIGGHDEITQIASGINVMRQQIADDVAAREKTAIKLTEAIKSAEIARSQAEERSLQLAKLAEEQTALREKAEQAEKVKSQFLSSMSHELRTPLNAILGFAQILVFDKDAPLNEDQKESVDQILLSGKHLLDLINDVLDLSKIENEDFDLSIQNVDTEKLIGEAIGLVQTLAAAKDITIHAHKESPEGFFLLADYKRLKQVLLNLLSNAVKYNHEGGEVKIWPEHLKEGRIRISVKDTGEGIAPEKIPALFKPFNRLGYENSSIEGTGIGLTITKKLVEAMNGSIGVDTSPGRGSTFWVEFPAAEKQV